MVYPQQFFTPINPDIIKFDIVYETLIRKQDSDLEMQFSQDERIQITGDITGKFDSSISQLVLPKCGQFYRRLNQGNGCKMKTIIKRF